MIPATEGWHSRGSTALGTERRCPRTRISASYVVGVGGTERLLADDPCSSIVVG